MGFKPEVGVRSSAEWMRLVEASYRPAGDLRAWGEAVFEAARPLLGGNGTILHVIRHSAAGVVTDVPLLCSDFQVNTGVARHEVPSPKVLRAFYYPPSVAHTFGELRRRSDNETAAHVRAYSETTGIAEGVGLVLHPEPGVVAVLQNVLDETAALTPSERLRLTRIGLHLEAALRLHLRPGALVAVMRPDGRLEHHAPSAPPAATLARAMADLQEADRRRRQGIDAVCVWKALAAGELSVVERFIGLRRHYFFLENGPCRPRSLAALTAREQDAVAAVCRSHLHKAAAYELGISEAQLSRRLVTAAAKLGLGSRMDLIRIAAMLTRDPRAGFEDSAFTPTERTILELLSQGLSNAEIARIRSRSVRTIANQVASLLRKAGAASRRELALGSRDSLA